MKKILLIVLIFLFLSFSIFAMTDEELKELGRYTKFNINLTKLGVTTFYFSEYGSDSRINLVSFSIPDNGSSSAFLRFGWSIYNEGKYTISLVFQDNNNSGADHWMLFNDDLNNQRGYNYQVDGQGTVTSATSNGKFSCKLPAPSEIASEADRTLDVITAQIDNSTIGNTGYVDLVLTLNVPSGEGSFNTGQYSGIIMVNVEAG